MRMIFVFLVASFALSNTFADIGDKDSVVRAFQKSQIRPQDIQQACSDLKDNFNNPSLVAKQIHPLLRFVAACVASANSDLLNLAVFIKASYDKDKKFIEEAFGFKWGAKEGNQDEQNIYKIVGLAADSKVGDQAFRARAMSSLLEYKILGAGQDVVYKYIQFTTWWENLWGDEFWRKEDKPSPVILAALKRAAEQSEKDKNDRTAKESTERNNIIARLFRVGWNNQSPAYVNFIIQKIKQMRRSVFFSSDDDETRKWLNSIEGEYKNLIDK